MASMGSKTELVKPTENRMMSANDIKMNIIDLITRINDLNKLKLIYQNVEEVDKSSVDSALSEKRLDFRDAAVEIREGVSYEQILHEQDYQPISYQEFRALADQIEWEHSLKELLEALD